MKLKTMIINFRAPLKFTKIKGKYFVDCDNLFDIINSSNQLGYVTKALYPENITLDSFWTSIADISNKTPNETFKITNFKHKNGKYKLNKLTKAFSGVLIKPDTRILLGVDVAVKLVSGLSSHLVVELIHCIDEITSTNASFDIIDAIGNMCIEFDTIGFEPHFDNRMCKGDWINYFDTLINSSICYFD